MMASRQEPPADIKTKPIGYRAGFGAKRGAVAGIYFLAILFATILLTDRSAYLLAQPLIAAPVFLAGFSAAGALLLSGIPYATSTGRAIAVGLTSALPATIVLYDLPPDVIVVRGRCGIKYFLWGDDVVLVDSCTRRVVDIVALG